MDNLLTDKVAIITGAGRGEGEAIAYALAAAGVRVAVNDINPDRAERVAAAIRTAGGQALSVPADISNRFQASHLIETTRAEWGRLDILVNYASVKPAAPLLKLDEWEWARCLDVNLKGAFFMTQLCGRVMADENAARDGGAIINIGAEMGDGRPQAAYAASKAGLAALTAEAERELSPANISLFLVEHIPGETAPLCIARLRAWRSRA
jgi:NAD(P)-dependent dehydrogenase (short-subunit alcohol dehydrogenase family)